MTNTVVVAGAGVSGLTSALLLSKSRANKVTVVAKHMPGDKDIEYASPWAGANFMPMSTEVKSRWERRTWPELKRLAEQTPEAGIHFQKVRVYRRQKDPHDPMFSHDPWYKALVPDYRELNQDEMIPGQDSGCEYTSVCINTAIYLAWLVGECIKNGVVFRRSILRDISDARALSHTGKAADIIVNATGLGSRKLGGVQDTDMTPARGQTVLVRNSCHPMVVSSGTDDGPTEVMYIMERAAGGGTIIGGTYDLGNWESQPDPDLAIRMLKRAVDARPDMADGKGIEGLSIISHNVGLRPHRNGGVRIEEGVLDDGTRVVHNYGHSSWGYQGSYGCAERVVELVDDILKRHDKKHQ